MNGNKTISDGRQVNAKNKTETTHFPREKACEGKEKKKKTIDKKSQLNNPSLEVSCPEEKKTHAQVYVCLDAG